MLLSGGVDSAVALKRLCDAGHDVTAFYLKIWLEDDLAFLGDCPWNADLGYVREICVQLNIPFEVVPLQREYFDRVVTAAIAELKAGRTPSPDIHCNALVKFGAFYDTIDDSFGQVATGHYARIDRHNGRSQLCCAPDPVKDQTYFLAKLRQDQLARACFPIGDLQKSQVRAIAESANLPPKNRKDSQGICFLGKISYRDFVRSYLGEKPGRIVHQADGAILGRHRGLWFHTIGQRQGLGLSGGPWYVARKDMDANTLFVTKQRAEKPELRYEFDIADMHWINDPPGPGSGLTCKLRHGPERQVCEVRKSPDPGCLRVHLEIGERAIAAGQYAILYQDDVCLGCGVMQ